MKRVDIVQSVQDMTPTEDELLLIDALQVWPRASWAKLGPVLAADPVTLARRWARLRERGVAWVTAEQPWASTPRGAVIEVECEGPATEDLIGVLVQDGPCLSVDVTSGSRNLLLTVATTSDRELNRYALERLNNLAGVRAVRVQPVVRGIAVGSQWRLRALDVEQAAAIEAMRRDDDATRPARQGAVDAEIGRLLSLDGRVTSQAVAAALGITPRKARERLAATLSSEGLELRTDMPRWASGWPIAAWYFVRVPAAHLSAVGTQLRTLRSVRAVLSVAGPANVLVNVWMRSLVEVEHLEGVMEQQLPGVSVLDRSLVMAVRKRMGRVFDADESPVGVVPWAEV